MHRRDLLKALAAVPLATALAGCKREGHDEDEARRHRLEVHLDGAIAVVIQENKANSILAFSPRPKIGEEPHQFYFNGYPKSEDPKKSYHFKLSTETRDRDSKLEISPGLKDFSFQTKHWRVGDSLVTIELPAPRRITFSGHRSPVKFLSGGKAFMPTNHILEYDLKDDALPKLECTDSSLKCDPSPDSFPGVTRFFFEIGPKRSLDVLQSREHAIRFFNYILQQSFQDLAEKYQLDPTYTRGMEYPEDTTPRAVPTVFQYDLSYPLRQNASYAVDCEYAGPLASTSTLPSNP